ncbi:hypothetical protein PS15p_210257 [Mucor circinelloides]
MERKSINISRLNIVFFQLLFTSAHINIMQADSSTPKGTIRKRVTSRSNTNNAARGGIPGGSTSSMMRIYSDDSPGLRV